MEQQQKLKSDNVQERADAAEALCQMGPEAAIAAVDLVQACADDPSVQQWAVAALEEIGSPPVEAIEPLTDLITASNPLVAYWAITLLGRAGDAAKSSQNEIAAVLEGPSPVELRERAALALGKIDATSFRAIEALNKASGEKGQRLSRLAKTALGLPHN